MRSPSPCNDIQERLAADGLLGEGQQAHVLACANCTRLAEAHAVLAAVFAETFQDDVQIPEAFADGVMARLEGENRDPGRRRDLLGRRWVQIALAHVGLAIAVANVLRFVLASLLPTMSLGGAR